jgi:GlcNAc-P-P-Und epimerase
MSKISIVGGSGFVGTNLCKLLYDKNIDFEILDIKKSLRFPEKWKYVDIRDKNSIKENLTGKIVIHLAAVHRDDVVNKSEYFKTNVEGTKNLVSICTKLDIEKLIFTSTVAVYGFSLPNTDEDGEIKPFNDYGKSKFEAEEILRSWHALSNSSLIIVRPTVIFGPGNRGNVYNLFNQISSNKFIMIGRGLNKKSLAFIDNITDFLFYCLKSQTNYGLYNYSDNPDYDMDSLVKLTKKHLKGEEKNLFRLPYILGILIGYTIDIIGKITKRKFSISSMRVKKFCSSSTFSSKEKAVINFIKPNTLKEGIIITLDSEFISPTPNQEIFYTE